MRKFAEGRILLVPVSNSAVVAVVRIGWKDESLELKIGAVPEEEADFIATYALPWDWHDTWIEAPERFFEFVSYRNNSEVTPELHQYFHLTASRGWMNDPNGLYYRDGIWHCFYQHNPFSACWNNMHWAHASSRDLLHWENSGIALYPDRVGMMFSGAAVLDRENVSGLGKDALLLFYTNAHYGNGQSSQELAWSNDGGRTFHKYAKNPLIATASKACPRDPAPVYDPEAGLWRMPIYLGDDGGKREFQLWESRNLLDWKETCLYNMESGRECPGLIRMQDEADGQWKWVFTEANCLYRVGNIRDGKAEFLTSARKFLYGSAYAGQFFHDAPEGRHVYLAWVRMGGLDFKTWNGCMSLPMEMRLCNNTLLVRPYATPERKERIDKFIVPFEAEVKFRPGLAAVCRAGETECLFADGKIRCRGMEAPIPAGCSGGRLFVDRTSLEFFDETGLAPFSLSIPVAEEAALEGFASVQAWTLA